MSIIIIKYSYLLEGLYKDIFGYGGFGFFGNKLVVLLI